MAVKKTSLLIILLLLLFPILPACNGGGGSGGSGGGGDNDSGSLLQEQLFESSGHADATAEAFNHWDSSGEVQATCAKCHNMAGFLDFLGIDGATEGVVDNPVSIDPDADNAFDCELCHNEKTYTWTSVTFPSGLEVSNLGREAFCMECHQGRESTISVDAAIAAAPPIDSLADPVDADTPITISFKNVHYFAAAATQYADQAMGAYQYAEKPYDIKFAHVEGYQTCITCHNPHSLEVNIESCQTCHPNVQDEADLKDIRMAGSKEDYDGDGNTTEGIYYEIETLREKLYAAMQAYADEVVGLDIIYDASAHPYFFGDANGNGIVDEGEGSYDQWTARLLRAAYNYHYSIKDTGAFAHNGKYIIELLYDSIEDLNNAPGLVTVTDLSSAHRIDAGHFAGSEEAFRHWDSSDQVSSSCSRCHSATGLAEYLQTKTTVGEPISNGFLCSTCHDAIPNFASQRLAADVTFPSGEVVNSGDNTTNLCMQCHQGRESKVSVDTDVAGIGEDTVDSSLGFINVHYFAAGATRYGTEAKGAYEYDGKAYDGNFPHVQAYSGCTDCHDTHALEPKVEECGQCHAGVTNEADILNIRMAGSTNDYNGNGNVTEGIYYEIQGLWDTLYAAIQAYAHDTTGTNDIVYDSASHPYFFNDLNGNGGIDEGEGSYDTWTPRLLKAAYNLHYIKKDPGALAHNAKYVIELLYDSIEDLGSVPMTGLVRNDSGHFDTASEAFRHWDGSGEVQGTCSRCHTPTGFAYYIQSGGNPTPPAQPLSYGLTCETCHVGTDFAGTAPRKYVASVTFPGGATISNSPSSPDDSFLCMTCHQGRESKATIDAAIGAGSYGFKNVHYLPAGAVQYGHDAVVGYEYDGKTYAGKFEHWGYDTGSCTYCHELDPQRHTFEPKLMDFCKECHTEASGPEASIEDIRFNRSADYDGDGNAAEPLKDEIATLRDALYDQIRAYASGTRAIVYDEASHPYFFVDDNADGIHQEAETTSYDAWDAKLMKAAHNFQISIKEPGAWAHNTRYIVQLLIDSIEDLDGDVTHYDRP